MKNRFHNEYTIMNKLSKSNHYTQVFNLSNIKQPHTVWHEQNDLVILNKIHNKNIMIFLILLNQNNKNILSYNNNNNNNNNNNM